MSKDSSDVFGPSPNQTAIVIAIDSGTILNPPLLNGVTPLQFGPRQITIPANTLPSGNSFINVQIVFAPGDPDANITVATGSATVNAPATIDHTMFPSGINLFGE